MHVEPLEANDRQVQNHQHYAHWAPEYVLYISNAPFSFITFLQYHPTSASCNVNRCWTHLGDLSDCEVLQHLSQCCIHSIIHMRDCNASTSWIQNHASFDKCSAKAAGTMQRAQPNAFSSPQGMYVHVQLTSSAIRPLCAMAKSLWLPKDRIETAICRLSMPVIMTAAFRESLQLGLFKGVQHRSNDWCGG